MSYNTFDIDMVDRETLDVPTDSRLIRILSSNPSDSVYCFVPRDTDEDELEDELRLTFAKKYGRSSYGPFYDGYEDVSYLLDEITD